jgi:hypothetical protein
MFARSDKGFSRQFPNDFRKISNYDLMVLEWFGIRHGVEAFRGLDRASVTGNFCAGANLRTELKDRQAAARVARLAHNRALSCDRCQANASEPALVTIPNNTS